MRPDVFDALTRRVAGAGNAPGTRREVLRALGLGGTVAAFARDRTGAAPGGPSVFRRNARAQAAQADPVDEKAFALAYDVERIFAFVRDEVAYDPYAGMLRGAKGTLWGLAGNALDQAVLLAALLRASLVQTRLVVGSLGDEDAAALLGAGALDEPSVAARAGKLLAPPAAPATPPGALTPLEESYAAALPDVAGRVSASVDRHVAAGLATVLDGLERAGVSLPAPTPALPAAERERHVWVQYAAGPNWVDLDPSMPGAEVGQVFASEPTPLAAIPEDLIHRVSFRLIAERVADDASVTTDELLTHEAACADLLGVPITLMHPQPEALDAIGVAIGGLLGGFRNLVPTLLVGEETILGAAVTFDMGGGVLDTFGGESVPGDTLAEWLEITVTTPDGATTARRTLFDRVDAETRAAGTVNPTAVPPVETVASDDGVDNFLPLSGLWALSVVAGSMPAGAVLRSLPAELTADDILPALQGYHAVKDVEAMRLPALAGARLVVDAPNVTAFTLRPTAIEADGGSASIGIDLLHRSVAVAPGSAGGDVHPLVAAGVLGHAVEAAIFEAGGQEPLGFPLAPGGDVLRVFAEAEAQGIDSVVLRPGEGSAAAEMAAGPRVLVDEALAAGLVVIVPARPVTLDGAERTGWWLVDPETGATRDQMDDGGGSTVGEYAFLIFRVAACAALALLAAQLVVVSVVAAANQNMAVSAMADLGIAGMGGLAGPAIDAGFCA